MNTKILIFTLVGTALILALAAGSSIHAANAIPGKARIQTIVRERVIGNTPFRLKSYITIAAPGDTIYPLNDVRLKKIISKDSVVLELGPDDIIYSTDWTGVITICDSAAISHDLVKLRYMSDDSLYHSYRWLKIDTSFGGLPEHDSDQLCVDVSNRLTEDMLVYTEFKFYEDGQIQSEIGMRLGDMPGMYRHGLSRAWARNAQLIEEINYNYNCPTGRLSRWSVSYTHLTLPTN